jgi:glycosyltransferase involved in cell wall biosynthesis
VGVDATLWTNARGFGRFTRNLVGRLVELDSDTEYVLYIGERDADQADLPACAQHLQLPLRRPRSGALSADVARGPGDLVRLSAAVSRKRLDAFLFPCVDAYFPVFGVPTVVGLYDTILDDMSELALPSWRARLLWRTKQGWALRRSDRLFTLSESARSDFVTRFPAIRPRLTVVPGAADPCFRPRPADEARQQVQALELGLDGDFLLYAGGIGAHKNLETLLAAYGELRHQVTAVPPLVIVGPFQDPAYRAVTAPVRALAARLDLEADMRWAGFVLDDALAALYNSATAVVVTSLAEGFGLPAVEAAACGAPLVLSDIAPHREFIGDAAAYFPPTDAAELTRRLNELLGGPARRRALSGRAPEKVAGLSWERSARTLRDVIGEAVARSPTGYAATRAATEAGQP